MHLASSRAALRLGLVAAVSRCWPAAATRQPPAATSAAAASKLVTVTAGEQATPSELMLDGVVEAVNQATLSAQTAGRVAEVAVDINDRVQEGQLLVRLRAYRAGGWDLARRRQRCRLRARKTHRRAPSMTASATCTSARSWPVPPTTKPSPRAMRPRRTSRPRVPRSNRRRKASLTPNCARRTPAWSRAKRVQVRRSSSARHAIADDRVDGRMRVVAEVPQSAARAVQEARKSRTSMSGTSASPRPRITLYPSARTAVGHVPRAGRLAGRVRSRYRPGTFAKVGIVVGESNRILVPFGAVIERSELRAVYVVTPDGEVVAAPGAARPSHR